MPTTGGIRHQLKPESGLLEIGGHLGMIRVSAR